MRFAITARALAVWIIGQVLLPSLHSHAQEFGTWRSGNFSVEAKLFDANSTHVKLEKQDGQVLSVPIAKLNDHSYSRLNLNPEINRKICKTISGDTDHEGRLRIYKYDLKSQVQGPMTFSRDGRFIFFATYGNIVAIDSDTGKILLSEPLPGELRGSDKIAVSRDGHFLALAGDILLIWRINRDANPVLTRVSAFKLPRLYTVRSMAFSPSSDYLAASSNNAEILVLDTATGNYKCESKKDSIKFTKCDFEDDKTVVVSSGFNFTAFDIDTLETIQDLDSRKSDSPHSFLNRFKTRCVKSTDSYHIYNKEKSGPTKIGNQTTIQGFDGGVTSPDGKSLYAYSPYSIAHWDIASNTKVAEYDTLLCSKSQPDGVKQFAFSPCGRYIAGITVSSQRIYIFQPKEYIPFTFANSN